ENNELKNLNGEDAIRFFGHDNVFRRNYIHDDKKIRGNGNHPDFVQTFGDNGGESYNMLFEENWIENLSSQVGQLNSGGGGRPLDPDFYNYTFKNNVFVNIPGNFNIGVPGVKLINNTFYRTAGIIYGGSLSRGSAENGVVLNTAFVECGPYSGPHFVISSEVFNYFIPVYTTTATNIFKDLRNKGYVTNNGHLQDKFKVINNILEFELDASFSQYKSKVYDLMKQTQEIERISKETFVANYNFVAGKEIYGFPRVTNFNEPNGINGGNPLFVDIKNPLGPDKKPFTQDDGLRPMPSSPLCGSGENGKDIGALSCLIREDKPIAHISLDKEEGYEPLIVSFDASGSYIPQGITVQYYWDFGDGQEATGIKVNHVFNQDGIYTVTLKITDNKGNQSIATRTINVKNTQYPNVILYLPLNGNITDISGKNIQTNPIGTNLIFENGISEQALRTNQSTSRGINITHNDMLDGQNQMSFTFWAKKDNIEEQEVVIIKHTIYQIQITKNGITGYLNTENNGISLTATTNKNYDTQWHHYTITYDGSNVKAYIDGEEILSKPATGKIKIDRSRPLQIGLYPWGESFNGLIDEIIIYDKALNQQEINNIITQKTPISGFYTLTTTKTGTGNGTITSNPPGINCGNDCTENYQQNTTITLTATPEQNSIFDSWTGACTGTNNVCTITMNNNKTTIATFNTTQPNQIQLTITSPTPNTEISGMININAETTSNNPISEIRFFIDANLLGIDNTAPYSTTLNTHYYRNGAHEIKAIAKDNAGNTQTTTIIVKINNADNDNDGVSNIIDKCPNTRTGIKVNNYGCPFPIVDKFDIKPDFNNTDITTLNELEIGITNKGKIRWETTLKLTATINNTEEPLDLNNDLNISNNKISLNQNKLRELNKPATITLYTTTQNPKIMKDNKECTQCRIIEKTSTYVKFTVPNFEE
ncbi:MAG: LamG-like jellyroll fold domain-containing protein, partial [Candidatus Diapherotrites archaeon]